MHLEVSGIMSTIQIQIQASFIALLLFPGFARAGLGPELPAHELPSQVCMIQFYDASGSIEGVCSGVLISPRELLTAAHCLHSKDSQLPKHDVRCPGYPTTRGTQSRVHPLYDHEKMKIDPLLRQFDRSVLTLADPIPVSPIRVIERSEDILSFVTSADRCGIFGFGGVAPTSPQFGFLRGIEVFAESVFRVEGRIEIQALGSRVSALVEPGDSGGSLACRKGQEWTHLATISGRDMDYRSLLAPAGQDTDVLRPLVRRTAEEQIAQEQESLLRTEERRQITATLESAALCLKDLKSAFESGADASKDEAKRLTELESRHRDLAATAAPPLVEASARTKAFALLRSCELDKISFIRERIGATFYVKPYASVVLELTNPASIDVDSEIERQRLIQGPNPFSTVDHTHARLALERIDGDEAIGSLELLGWSESFVCRDNVLCLQGRYRNVRIALSSLDVKRVIRR